MIYKKRGIGRTMTLIFDFLFDEASQLSTRALVIAAWWDDISNLAEADVFFAMLLLGNKLTRNG